MNLPPKPPAVAHVSDAHWEAALNQAVENGEGLFSYYAPLIVHHARCLILLNEVAEPVDPIEAAMDAMFDLRLNWSGYGPAAFKRACRKHFAGKTFPEAQS
jgi:hypothetical protein